MTPALHSWAVTTVQLLSGAAVRVDPEALAQHQRAWDGDRPRLAVLTRCRAALQPTAAALHCWAGHNAAMRARGMVGLSPPAAMRAGRGPGKEVG